MCFLSDFISVVKYMVEVKVEVKVEVVQQFHCRDIPLHLQYILSFRVNGSIKDKVIKENKRLFCVHRA